MDAEKITNDVKTEIAKGIEKLATLRDEAKLHLHLATLDAMSETAPNGYAESVRRYYEGLLR